MYIKFTRKQIEAFQYSYRRYLISLRRRGATTTEILKAIELEKIDDQITGQTKLKF